MKAEKIVLALVATGLGTALIQAILRKQLVFNFWGYVVSTLQISTIFLFATPLAIYGLIHLVDHLSQNQESS